MRQRLFPIRELFNAGMRPFPDINSLDWALLQNCRTTGSEIEEMPTLVRVATPEACQTFKIGSKRFYVSQTKFYNSSMVLLLTVSAGPRKWSCADFGLYAVFSNGAVTVVRDDLGDFYTTTSIPQGNCIGEFNGQAIVGGLTSAPTQVHWSKIGSIDFTVDKSNEAGFREGEIGNIFFVKKLGDVVMCYGTHGIGQLYPAGSTFGYRVIKNCQIDNELSVCGSYHEHIIRMFDGEIWKATTHITVTEKFSAPVLLGYKEFFKQSPIAITYNKERQEAWLIYADRSYILNSKGLYSTNVVADSIFEGFYSSTLAQSQTSIVLETGKWNFKAAGLKQLSEIMLGLTAGTNVKVNLRVGSNESPLIPINSLNCVKPYITGEQFQVRIVADFAAFNISEINIQTINVDGRFGQGVQL